MDEEQYLTILIHEDADPEQLYAHARLLYRREPPTSFHTAARRRDDYNEPCTSIGARQLETAHVISLAEWELHHAERPWE